MYTLLGKIVSHLVEGWTTLEDGRDEPALKRLGRSDSASEISRACGDAVLGEVTHLNLVEQYGLINEEFFFKLSMAAGEELSVGTRVSAQIHGDGIRVKSLTVLPGPPPSSVVSKVTRVDQNCLHLLDFGNPLHLAVHSIPNFEICPGDWLQLQLDPKTSTVIGLEPLRTKELVGQVTRVTATGGIVDQQVLFSAQQWPEGKEGPLVNQQVTLCAIESDQGTFRWRALSLELYEDHPNVPEESIINGVQPQEVVSIPEGFEVTRNLDFGVLEPGQSRCLDICISNRSERPHLLLACKVEGCQVSLAQTFRPVLVASQDTHIVQLSCTASVLGSNGSQVILDFEEGFTVCCCTTVTVVDPLEKRLEAYNARSQGNSPLVNVGPNERLWTVPGDRPSRRRARLPVELPHFPVPTYLKNLSVRELDRMLGSTVRTPLSPVSYVDRLQLLLHLEEMQLSMELERRVLSPAQLDLEGSLVRLSLSSWLEEKHILPKVGDRVLVHNVQDPNIRYEGFVYQVMSEDALLKLGSGFNERLEKNGKLAWELRFQLNRTPMRRCHLAVRLSRAILKQVLFPKGCPRGPMDMMKLELVNRQLNDLQQAAVRDVLGNRGGILPYVVWGPPGTGKTVTLVEAMLQVLLNIKHSRILACAPSNSAADLLAEKLWSSQRLRPSDIVRLLGFQRDRESVPLSIRQLCLSTEGLERASRHRIVVSTVSTAGALYGLGLPPDHFTHAFLDEAGQATEPEALVVVGLVSLGAGSLILGGDPLQLGPVVRSRLASRGGLGTSLLERLLLQSSHCPVPVTKLQFSYRCPQELLQPYSTLFYEGKLLSRVPKMDRGMLPRFPVLFHGVRGCAKKEGACPSWFNPAEAVQVVRYLQKAYGPWGLRSHQVGLLTPYRRQSQKLRLLLDSMGLQSCKVGSAEEFQGQERHLVIVSTVRGSEALSTRSAVDGDKNQELDFLFCSQRFNVAISRASAMLVVVGNPDVLMLDPNWKALIDYCQQHGAYVGCNMAFQK